MAIADPGPPRIGAADAKVGFLDGMRSLFSGFGFVLTTPGVWHLCLIPMVIALVLAGALSSVALTYVPPLVESWMGVSDSAAYGALVWVVQFAATAAAVIAALLVSAGSAQTLAGPALEALVRRRERALGLPERAPTPFVLDIVRSLKSALLPFVVATPIIVVLFVIEIAFAPAAVVTIPLKVLVTTLAMGWDICDYPLSVRGMPIGERMSFIRVNLIAVVGFSVGLVLIALIPCGLLLALPAGVAGATHLIHRIEGSRPGGAPSPGGAVVVDRAARLGPP